MGVEVVAFDCGGVLLQNRDLTAYEAWEVRLGLQRGELSERLWHGEAWSLAERGKITEEEFWPSVGRELGLSDEKEIAALRDDMWRTWAVDEKVLSLVDSVRERYKVAVLTNATDALEDALADRYQIADRFDAIINSARLGSAKPEKGPYEELLRRFEVEADQILIIDDQAENISVAAGMGMHVIWFIHADELERQLSVYVNGIRGSSGEEHAPGARGGDEQ